MSEVTTLEFLEETAVPSPKVYLYQLESYENPVDISLVLMEKMPGTALQWNDASFEQSTKVMEQLVDTFLELEKHLLEKTESTVPADVRGRVGGFAQAPLFETSGRILGPFSKLEAAYKAMITGPMNAIGNEEITSLPVDTYLAFRWRLSARSSLTSPESNEGPFYRKHYDAKGDHILVDDNFNITEIIDWEFASAEANGLAFSSPCMMRPVEDYYDGLNNISENETEFARIFETRRRKDSSEIVLNGRRWSGSCSSSVARWKMTNRHSRRCSKVFESHLLSMVNQTSRHTRIGKLTPSIII